eukprot:165177-Chlamydomonas_euryale.AAC.1
MRSVETQRDSKVQGVRAYAVTSSEGPSARGPTCPQEWAQCRAAIEFPPASLVLPTSVPQHIPPTSLSLSRQHPSAFPASIPQRFPPVYLSLSR